MEVTRIVCVGIVLSLVMFHMLSPLDAFYESGTVASRAKLDTSVIGCYDSHVTVSVYHWVYGIFVQLYRYDKKINCNDIIREWYTKSCHEEEHLILDGIEKAYTQFLSDLDTARQQDADPRFKVSADFNYHFLPKTISFNDRIDSADLIAQLDSITGGIV